ncbi:MAG: hypothetical protein M3264_12230 [Thermoproteota archaeon]|nr:hypothetical protein [Thermoproteota archaeon]
MTGKTLIFIALATFLVGAVAATVIGSTTEAVAVSTKRLHYDSSDCLVLFAAPPFHADVHCLYL